MSVNFKIHGDVTLHWSNDILHIDSSGPWNMEFFQHLHAELFNAVRKHNKQGFCVLLSIKGEALPTPEGQAFHTEFLKSSSAKAVAVNLEKCITKSMTRDVCHKVYTDAGLIHQCFESKDQALTWLSDVS